MEKTGVIFVPQQIADGDWQIHAHCPGAEIKYVDGFKDKAEIDKWLAGNPCRDWLKAHGYAK